VNFTIIAGGKETVPVLEKNIGALDLYIDQIPNCLNNFVGAFAAVSWDCPELEALMSDVLFLAFYFAFKEARNGYARAHIFGSSKISIFNARAQFFKFHKTL